MAVGDHLCKFGVGRWSVGPGICKREQCGGTVRQKMWFNMGNSLACRTIPSVISVRPAALVIFPERGGRRPKGPRHCQERMQKLALRCCGGLQGVASDHSGVGTSSKQCSSARSGAASVMSPQGVSTCKVPCCDEQCDIRMQQAWHLVAASCEVSSDRDTGTR